MTPTKAQLRRRCCERNLPGVGNTRRARWELYAVVLGAADWPTHQWQTWDRHSIPSVQERTDALTGLGFEPAPGAEWTWQESETVSFHGHLVEVTVLGTIDIVPLASGRTS